MVWVCRACQEVIDHEEEEEEEEENKEGKAEWK